MIKTPRPFLELRNLSKSFGGLQALMAVSLSLHAGQVQALIGPNGAGKSTLVALLCGSLNPDQGQVFLDGLNLAKVPEYERTRRGLVRSFQVSSVFPSLSVLENICLSLLSRQSPHMRFFRPVMWDKVLQGQAVELAKEVGLSEHLETLAKSLSHGGRRLLELAMTMALTPRVLLLDEPMAGLDLQEAERVANSIANWKHNRAILLIEHDLDMVFRLADKIAVLVEGQLIANDTPSKIRANPFVQSAYIHA